MKDEFDITIEPYYLNDGCSQAQSLDTAIQRFVLLATPGRCGFTGTIYSRTTVFLQKIMCLFWN